jgi:predicted nucleotidyltransferase
MSEFTRYFEDLLRTRSIAAGTVAEYLNISLTDLKKIENGKSLATKEQVKKLAVFFDLDESELLVKWLSENTINNASSNVSISETMQVSDNGSFYLSSDHKPTISILQTITDFFQSDGRIKEAWVFGSFARNESFPGSDIDLMVDFIPDSKVSLFDFADICYKLEKLVHRKIDLVEKDCIKPFAWETAKTDLIKFYG